MTAKLCATMRVNIHVTYSSNVDSIVYTEVTLPDKFVGCDYIETVSCCSTSGNQSGTIVFANSYCYAGCTSTMLMTRSGGDLCIILGIAVVLLTISWFSATSSSNNIVIKKERSCEPRPFLLSRLANS